MPEVGAISSVDTNYAQTKPNVEPEKKHINSLFDYMNGGAASTSHVATSSTSIFA